MAFQPSCFFGGGYDSLVADSSPHPARNIFTGFRQDWFAPFSKSSMLIDAIITTSFPRDLLPLLSVRGTGGDQIRRDEAKGQFSQS